MGSETMVGDQGGPNSYPGDYFNGDAPQKYKIKGSFGHPVSCSRRTNTVLGRESERCCATERIYERKRCIQY
ncbi:hypothetical protein NXY15_04960 [Bacteroides thetaiotaomicron]|nr:hypothetical protein NXY15_04960 [Bacteroides thetaiotaomicron]